MKRWLITGASRGLGAEIAQAVLATGDTVVVTARSADALAGLFGKTPNAVIVPIDVTNEQGVIDAIGRIDAQLGGIDILVNNAGYGVLGAIEEVSAREIEDQYRTNVFGMLNMIRAVLPVMRRQRAGHIINMSSLGGYAAMPGWGAYHSSKFAVEGISESLSQEVAPLGIAVTVLEPVHFQTAFMSSGALVVADRIIADYAATSGASRQQAEQVSAQSADPAAPPTGLNPRDLAAAIIKIAYSENPPFRVPIGQRSLDRLAQKHAAVEAEIEKWLPLCRLENLS
jgi:NAD(P)-dependent dehydrogenase (short-subunit alcohol dehydrogenase family)